MISPARLRVGAGARRMSAGDDERRSPCGPCCRWSSSRAASDGTVAVGVVEPRYKTNLAFRVLGTPDRAFRLRWRPRQRKDKPSAPIDSTALELAVRSAKAELAKAEAQLANARATEERQRTLIASDATTKQTLDNAEQARAGAEAIGRARAGQSDQGHRAARLCAAQGGFRWVWSPRWAQRSGRWSRPVKTS